MATGESNRPEQDMLCSSALFFIYSLDETKSVAGTGVMPGIGCGSLMHSWPILNVASKSREDFDRKVCKIRF